MAGIFVRLQVTTASVIALLLAACSSPALKLNEMKTMEYASGSSIEFIDNRIYIAGDDARYILIMDTDLNIIDSISVEEGGSKRMRKSDKHDYEAMVLLPARKDTSLLVIGSGSALPGRGFGLLIDPHTRDTQHIDLNPLFARLKNSGISELNIEGAAYVQGTVILSNRGHQANMHNHLIFLPAYFLSMQDSVEYTISRFGFTTGEIFRGVSGLDYSFAKDKLVATVSTEHTSGTSTDGEIGKSFLWISDNILRGRAYEGVNPTRIIDLERSDKRFAGHKIESVCILNDQGSELEMLLVSDNDDGKTTLFRVRLRL